MKATAARCMRRSPSAPRSSSSSARRLRRPVSASVRASSRSARWRCCSSATVASASRPGATTWRVSPSNATTRSRPRALAACSAMSQARRTASAVRRPGPSSVDTPTDTVTISEPPADASANGARIASRQCWASRIASSSASPGRKAMNSSPPARARQAAIGNASRTRAAIARSNASPAAWPWRSLKYLKLSTSSSTTTPVMPARSAAARLWCIAARVDRPVSASVGDGCVSTVGAGAASPSQRFRRSSGVIGSPRASKRPRRRQARSKRCESRAVPPFPSPQGGPRVRVGIAARASRPCLDGLRLPKHARAMRRAWRQPRCPPGGRRVGGFATPALARVCPFTGSDGTAARSRNSRIVHTQGISAHLVQETP